MAAKTVDPNVMAKNWSNGMAGAGAKYAAGINRTTANPMQLAAQPDAMQRYQDGCVRSVTSGKRAASLNAADVGTWKANAVKYGASNLATAGQKALPKYTAAAQKLAPVLSQASAAAHALPKGGLGNAMNRVNAALSVIMGAYGST